MPKGVDIIPILDQKIAEFEAERDKIQPVVNRFAWLNQQLDNLKRTRNTFATEQQGQEILPSETGDRGKLGNAILAILKDAKKPLHTDGIMQKLAELGMTTPRATVVGTLAKFVKELILVRTARGTYSFERKEKL